MTETTDTASVSSEHCEFAAMAAPGEAHERLKSFVGTFKAEVRMWMGPGDPMISTGTMINEFDLGGRFLRQHYTGDPGEGPFPQFEGRGYWGFNKATGKYEGVWMDTASTVMQTETGDVEGNVWTMVGEMPDMQGGSGFFTKKSIITLIDDDHHSMEMYMPGPDGNEVKGMEIQYTRA